MADRPGAVGITSRLANFTESRRIIAFPTGSTDRSRTAAPQASPAAATTGRSPSASGIPLDPEKAATPFQTPSIRMLSTTPVRVEASCDFQKRPGKFVILHPLQFP